MAKHVFTRKIELELPYIDSFMDYHDIDHEVDNLNEQIGKNAVKAEEINLEDYGYEFPGEYYAIFWTGRKPSVKTINELLKPFDLERFEEEINEEQLKKLNALKEEYRDYFVKDNGYNFRAKVTEDIYVDIWPDWDNGLDFSIVSYKFVSVRNYKNIQLLVALLNSAEFNYETKMQLFYSLKEVKEYGEHIKNFADRSDKLAKELDDDPYGFFEEHFMSMG